MLRFCLAAGTLATVSAMTEELTVSHRALQGSGNSNTGGADVSICRWQQNNPQNNPLRNFITASVGTLHDDETDEVDCQQIDPNTGYSVCANSQEHGNGYGDNIDCHATISAEPTYTITLDFSHLNLEDGPGCESEHNGHGCDVLTVYDGNDMTAPVIGVFSGSQLPPPISSTGSSLTIRFETDAGNYALTDTTSDPGFYADWHITEHLITQGDGICPAPAVYTSAHGTIHDEAGNVDCTTSDCQHANTGGNGYQDGTNCYTTIHAAADEQVRFTCE